MNILKPSIIILFAGTIITLGYSIGERLSMPGAQSLVANAEARVGRPLTPVSVAGVARRTVRRCAVGVYNCSLPGSQFPDNLIGQTITLSGTGENLNQWQQRNRRRLSCVSSMRPGRGNHLENPASS